MTFDDWIQSRLFDTRLDDMQGRDFPFMKLAWDAATERAAKIAEKVRGEIDPGRDEYNREDGYWTPRDVAIEITAGIRDVKQ